MNKMQNLTKKYFNMLNNSTVIKNNLINSGIKKRFLQYSEFPM